MDPATGQEVTKWTQDTKLDPGLQAALDAQIKQQQARSEMATSMTGRMQDEFGRPMDWGGLTGWAQAPQGTNTQTTTNPYGFGPDVRGRAEEGIYQSAASRLDPAWQQREKQMSAQLANQGITQGSGAYSRAMDDMSRQRTDAYQQAMMGAVTGGGAEAQREQAMRLGQEQQGFGQSLQSNAQNYQQQQQAAAFQNQMRQQQLMEEMSKRGFTLNEMNALMSGQQVGMPQFGGYSQAGQAQGADLMGAMQAGYGAQQQQFQNQQAATTGTVGGLASLAAMAMMFSDRRLKQVIKRLDTHTRGFGIYLYRFIGERLPRIGVLAQEVQRYAPELVIERDGVLMVDYSRI